SILCFVVVKSLETIPVVEKHGRSTRAIDGQTVEPAIQPFRKIVFLFVSVDQVGRPGCSKLMSTLPERLPRAPFGKLLAGKNQRFVPTLIFKRHAVRKRAFSRYPSNVNPAITINPSTTSVKWLVA